jgi:hypothetical protein
MESMNYETKPEQIAGDKEKFDALMARRPVLSPDVLGLPVKRAVTYIATATDSIGGTLQVEVLASNACCSHYFGNYRTVEDCKEAVKRLGEVTWVTPYRFAKEATC